MKVHKELRHLFAMVRDHPEAQEIVLRSLRLKKLGPRNYLVQWILTPRMFWIKLTLDEGTLNLKLVYLKKISIWDK